MTELEKDRLIETFMGWKLSWNNEEGKRGWSFYNEESKEYLHKTTYSDSTIGFTTDWNWLMKALYKFDMLYNNIIFTNEKSRINYRQYSELSDNLNYAVTSYNISDTVNALCEGIEWYNSTLN